MHRNHREKRNTWWRLSLAVLLASSLGLMMAGPVAASPDIEGVSVDVTTPTVGTESEYVIDFTPNVGLYPPGNVIIIEFPAGTDVPSIIDTADVTVEDLTDGESGEPNDVDVSGNTVTVYLPEEAAGVEIDFRHSGRVTFAGPPNGAGITNPTVAGNYCLNVSTDEEPTPVAACYDIVAGPVDIFLKYQVPLEDSGWIDYELVGSFETIGAALEYADDIWLENTEWGAPGWGLYSEPPATEFDGYYIGVLIEVSPGTYPETIDIDTPGVELVSTDGAAVTIIDGWDLSPKGPGDGAVVYISSGSVTFDGFTVINGGGDLWGWNDVDDNGLADTSGIWVDPNGEKCSQAWILRYPDDQEPYSCTDGRVNVLNNVVHDNQGDGIRADDVSILVSGNDVHDNRWDGFHGDYLWPGVETYDLNPDALTGGDEAHSEINMNQFHNNGSYLDGDNMGDGYDGWTQAGIDIGWADGLYIVDNNINNNQHAGIHLQDYATEGMINIRFNQIVDNGVFGITTEAYNPWMATVVYNNISGNPDWGIKNWEDRHLVASMNWWGNLSGPSSGVEPAHPEIETDQTAVPDALGRGDAVSHYVIYQWWLTYPFEDVQTDLIRYYGSDRYQGIDNDQFGVPWTEIVELSQGWNTLSTPVLLDSRADQMGEIVALGGWMQNVVIAYYYDPIDGWQQVLVDYQLMPLEAIYIRMSAPDYLPILLNGSNYQPSRDLGPGWNLVSLNAGFWSQEIQYMGVGEALAPISGNWSTAISPIMPGQEVSWVVTSNNINGEEMYIGDGYWVFVTEPTTLAGFRMAPWYLDEWEMDLLNGAPLWNP